MIVKQCEFPEHQELTRIDQGPIAGKCEVNICRWRTGIGHCDGALCSCIADESDAQCVDTRRHGTDLILTMWVREYCLVGLHQRDLGVLDGPSRNTLANNA